MAISRRCVACVLAAVTLAGVCNGQGGDDLGLVQTRLKGPTKYRVMFYKTFGGDHTCLTEVAFFDESGNQMTATYDSMSSCYGCTSCENCTHRYGNAAALFDGKWKNSDPDGWACTAPGSFTNGDGQQSVVVELPKRPAKMELQRAMADGDWVTAAFTLEEQQPDDSWWVIATPTEVTQVMQQVALVLKDGGEPTGYVPQPDAPWDYDNQDWSKNYPACKGQNQAPISLKTGADMVRGEDRLNFAYHSVDHRALANTGKGLQVGGNFGSITLPNGDVYESKQFHFHFPAEHDADPPVGAHPALGEMQIVHQKVGSNDTDGLLMVALPLNLPVQDTDQTDEELFFRGLGLMQAPDPGAYTFPFSRPIDLNIFARQLQGNFWYYSGSLATPPCTADVHWIVLQEQAHISGDIVAQLQKSAPNARTVQDTGGRTVSMNKLPDAAFVFPDASSGVM